MKIYPSVLAFDLFKLEELIAKFASITSALHVDIIDASVSNFIGVDFRILKKLHILGHKFNVHYMAKWNDELVAEIFEYQPTQTFFHKKHIGNTAMFENLKNQYDIGMAIELDEIIIEEDIATYLLMNVPLGHCGQKFSDGNIKLSYQLQLAGKKIISDGGINLENIDKVRHFDAVVIGNALMQNPISHFQENLQNNEKTNDWKI